MSVLKLVPKNKKAEKREPNILECFVIMFFCWAVVKFGEYLINEGIIDIDEVEK